VVPCSQHGLPARAADLRGARPLGGGATRFSSDSETVAGSRARGRTEKSLRRLLPIDASVAGRPDDARHLHGGGELGARPHGDAVRPLCRASFSSSRSRLALHSWRHCATGPHPPPRATTRSGVRGSPRISERQRSAAGPRLPPPRATTRRSARGWLHLARRLVAAPVALVFLPGGAARRSGPPLPRRDSKQPSTASRRLPTPDGADPLLHPRAHGGDAFPPATSGDDAPPTFQQQRGLTHFLPPPRGAWGAARRSASYPDAAPHLRRGCSARRTLCLPCCPLARSSADRG
jgi:hypothetical protein